VNKDIKELLELTWNCADEYYAEHQNLGEKLAFYRKRLATVGCWIPCDEQNPPPTEIPDDTSMIVYVQAHPDYPRGGAYQESGVRVVVDTWVGMGKLGHDITHYMLMGEPK
jgi:hypothetical protein